MVYPRQVDCVVDGERMPLSLQSNVPYDQQKHTANETDLVEQRTCLGSEELLADLADFMLFDQVIERQKIR